MKDKKNVFAAISDAARSVQDDEQQPDQPEISSKKKAGKRSHPDYRQTSIYVDKTTHRKLLRVLEDSGFEGDFSDWVEEKMKGEINVWERSQ